MIRRRTLLLGAIAIALGTTAAIAAHFGSRTDYAVLGFTSDGKHLYFTRTWSGMGMEKWMAIYDASTLKLKTSQPVERSCGPMCEGQKEISEQVGQKTIAKLHAKYGAPDAATVLKMSPNTADGSAAITSATGYVQTFTNKDVQLVTKSKLRGKKLPPADDLEGKAWPKKTVTFDVELEVTARGTTRKLKRTVYVENVVRVENANQMEWPELHVQEAAVSPDGNVVAFVFARRPYFNKLPAATQPVPTTK